MASPKVRMNPESRPEDPVYSMRFEMTGQVILVTGAGSGIGRAAALLAAQSGAKVLVADVAAKEADVVVEAIRGTGGHAIPLHYDVRDPDASVAEIDRAEGEAGPISGLIASAGISRPAPAEQITPRQWQDVLDTNLNGLFYSVQDVGRRMIMRGTGSIVTMASVTAFGGMAGRSHYTTSKYAVVGLTKSLAIEWGRHGVRVNAVAPGFVDTPLLQRNIPQRYRREVMIDRVPLARLATAEDVANACMFLLSDAAAYITGTVLTIDGGLTAGFFTRKSGGDYASQSLLDQGVYSDD
jgi:NAD(P)-dependent dehydrogenase (short-subunit alcohol dehydrogenase family)